MTPASGSNCMSVEKLLGLGIAGGGGLVASLNQISVPLLGVPLTVVTMAIGGALASFGYGEKVESKKKMYTMAGINAFIATICVTVLPGALDWDWVSPKVEPALAAMIAVGARFVMPQLIEMVPKIIKRIFKLDEYRSNQENTWDSPNWGGRRYYGGEDTDNEEYVEDVDK